MDKMQKAAISIPIRFNYNLYPQNIVDKSNDIFQFQ